MKRVLTEDEMKEAVALWVNCTQGRNSEIVDASQVTFTFLPHTSGFIAEVYDEDSK